MLHPASSGAGVQNTSQIALFWRHFEAPKSRDVIFCDLVVHFDKGGRWYMDVCFTSPAPVHTTCLVVRITFLEAVDVLKILNRV